MQSPEALILQLVHVRIMQQDENVGVLLNGSGFPGIVHGRWPFLFCVSSVQLRQGDNRDVQLLCQAFQPPADVGNFLLPVAPFLASFQQLQVVHADQIYPAVLVERERGLPDVLNVVPIRAVEDLLIRQQANGLCQLYPAFRADISAGDLAQVHHARRGEFTFHQLVDLHLHGDVEDTFSLLRCVHADRHCEDGLSNRRPGADNHQLRSVQAAGHLVQRADAGHDPVFRFTFDLLRFAQHLVGHHDGFFLADQLDSAVMLHVPDRQCSAFPDFVHCLFCICR